MLKNEIAYCLIIDIGKTHVKIHVIDANYVSLHSMQMSNTVSAEGLYPSADVDKIWQWLCENIQKLSLTFRIEAISITTHGATAALINRHSISQSPSQSSTQSISKDGLVLPIVDYEHTKIYDDTPEYNEVRPSFSETYSPNLPAGLNLGRQLYWLKKQYPNEFTQATDILMYPQYWAWRFTGQRVSEITSLACHTDLWSVEKGEFSSLVDTLQCKALFPPIQPAWFDCGKVLPHLMDTLGLDDDVKFYSGIHDSNASFLRYRQAQNKLPFTVISSGTWTILMASKVAISNLNANKDMLANVDAFGSPIACARFMGGREFERICEQAGSWLGEQFDAVSLQSIIDKDVYALPDFSDGSGPFGGLQSAFIGPVNKISGIALATLYCALMIDYQLTMLSAKGDIIIEGAFLKNPLMCAVIQQLRPLQRVCLSEDSTGTVVGAAYLCNWLDAKTDVESKMVTSLELDRLEEYKDKWTKLINESGHS